MNKFIPLLLGLMIPFAGAMADTFTDEAVEFCKKNGGQSFVPPEMTAVGDKYCKQISCRKSTSDKYVINETDKGPEANVEATKQVCVPKSVIDGNFNTNGVQSGSNNGNGSGPNGSNNGNGSGPNGSNNGNGSGPNGSNNGNGSGPNGSNNGNGSGSNGSNNGNGGNSSDIPDCVTKTGQRLAIGPGHICYDDCKPKGILGWKKSGLERKSCVECLMGQGYDFDDAVKKKAGIVIVSGVTVTVCRDDNGNHHNTNSNGSCPSGTRSSGTTNIGFGNNGNGSGSGNGGTTISVGSGNGNGNGGVGGNGTVIIAGSGNGGLTPPAYCNSTKKKDIEACDDWMRKYGRFNCSMGSNISACTGGASDDIYSRYDLKHCANCEANMAGARQQSTWSGVAEVIAASAPIVSTGLGAYFGYKGQQAWAGAAKAGFEQCRLNQLDYMQQLSAAEMSLSPTQKAQLGCNGFQLNSYAGLGNGYVNGLIGAGYSPGYLSGVLGPYGAYNPYGGVNVSGGINVGGGLYTGGAYGGVYNGGTYAGGLYNGGVINGGLYNGGVINGGLYNGGTYSGGLYNGGVINGGLYTGGVINGGLYNGGTYSGGLYNGGVINGGLYTGGVINGGLYNGGTYSGGLYNGGVINGGLYNGGTYSGGLYNGGVINGGLYNGGTYSGGLYNGGVINGGLYNGGTYAGGLYNGGVMNGGMSSVDLQGANYDRMMQQQGTAYQMSGLNGFGASGYPANMGGLISGGLSMSGRIGW